MFILRVIVLLLLLSSAVSAVPDENASRELRKRDPILGSQYYTLTRDLRECLSPLCGGYFVQALNQQWTQCHNRRLSLEGCYVAALDLSSYLKNGLDQSRFLETIMSGGSIVLGRYKPSAAYPDAEGLFADLVVEVGWVPFEEQGTNPPLCDCGPDEVCVDDPSVDCFGCTCPTICRSIAPVTCGPGGAHCPPNLFCITENPFCGDDVCESTCVTEDVEQSFCGGVTGLECRFGLTCIYPNKECDPAVYGAVCEGVCVQKIGAFCGGIAGFPCYPGLACMDPLGDGCDSGWNGADCGGICLPEI
jgi:hypothetical protein